MPLNDEEGVPPAADDEGIAGELARCCRELDAADAAHTCMLARYESFDTGNRGYLLPTDVGAVLEALGYDGHDDEAYISSLFTCFAAYGGSDDTQLDVEGFEQMWDHLGGEERAVAVEAWAASVAGASVLRKMGSAAATLLDVSTGGAAGQLVRVVSAKQSPTARAKRQVEVRRKVRVGAAAAGALGADLERRRAAAAADAEVETEAERLRVIAEAKAAAAERANRHRRLADYERRKQLRTRRGQFGPQIWFVLLKTIPASLIVSYLFITTVADIRQADTATCLVNGANSTGLLAGMADRVEDEEWGDCQPQDLSCLQNEMVAEVAEDWTDLMHYMEMYGWFQIGWVVFHAVRATLLAYTMETSRSTEGVGLLLSLCAFFAVMLPLYIYVIKIYMARSRIIGYGIWKWDLLPICQGDPHFDQVEGLLFP